MDRMLLMGKKSRLLMSLALVATLITGCSSTKPKVPDEPPEVLYQKARLKLDTGNYLNAIELLEALDSRYPFGAYSNQVQLNLIYAYYKQMMPPRRSPISTASSASTRRTRTSITCSTCAV